MIRTIIVAILAAGIASIAWMGVSRQVGQFSISAVWVSGLYERKEAAARRTRDAKIVLVGGSATHYGFSARELQLLTGIPAVNLGTHGGLGMEYLLYRARRSIRRGDIAVLAIEP